MFRQKSVKVFFAPIIGVIFFIGTTILYYQSQKSDNEKHKHQIEKTEDKKDKNLKVKENNYKGS